jgi:hypothetical protein
MMKKYLLALLPLLFFLGCTHLSVKHLSKKPWSLNTSQTLDMRFWTFEYKTFFIDNSYNIKGVAYPKKEVIPAWAEWIQDLWFSAYLSDINGHVVAKDLKVYLPSKLDYLKGVQFEFQLQPEKLPSAGPLFVTFGYSMQLTPHQFVKVTDRPLTGEETRVFYASQGALTR